MHGGCVVGEVGEVCVVVCGGVGFSVTAVGVVVGKEVSQLGGVVPQDGAERCEVLGSSFYRRGREGWEGWEGRGGVGEELAGCCNNTGLAYLACALLGLQFGEGDDPAIK